MLIRVWIDGRRPLAGTAVTAGREPLRFNGWLELLRVVSEFVGGAPGDSGDTATPTDARTPGGEVRPLLRPAATAHEHPTREGNE